jgi:penicillin-binding protein 1A
MVDALIATEDHRFYAHHGIDLRRTIAAGLHTFSGSRQGGSTITQQLARNLYPDEIGRAPTLTRKVKELITAFKIETVYSKDEILETYLNTVPFLYNAYGVEMAARTYFGKSADQLDIVESATLVGMLKGNSYYNPVLNPSARCSGATSCSRGWRRCTCCRRNSSRNCSARRASISSRRPRSPAPRRTSPCNCANG